MSWNPVVVAADAIRGLVELSEWQMEEIKRGLEEADRSDFASDSEVERSLSRGTRAAP